MSHLRNPPVGVPHLRLGPLFNHCPVFALVLEEQHDHGEEVNVVHHERRVAHDLEECIVNIVVRPCPKAPPRSASNNPCQVVALVATSVLIIVSSVVAFDNILNSCFCAVVS